MQPNLKMYDECAICQKKIPSDEIEDHVNQCFEKQAIKFQSSPASNKRSNADKTYGIFNCTKKPKIEATGSDETAKKSLDLSEKPTSSIKSQTSTKQTALKAPQAPLADLMRPTNFSDYFGQERAVGENSIIRNLLKNNTINSCIFYGSAGTGKTTLAHIIFNHCNQNKEMFRFVKMSACTANVSEVKEAIKQAKSYRDTFKKQTILFMDEIHRFNKLQQDTFLPHIENGTIILLGATTENPSFSLNNALLSRCRVIILDKLKSEDIVKILKRALTHFDAVEVPENVDKNADDFVQNLDVIPKITITDTCLKWIADTSDGDARIALNSLEMCMKQSVDEKSDEIKMITLKDIRDNIKRTHLLYDRAGDQHYDIISALHKSIRASDDNASLYWVTRMIEAGEDPRFICRRLIRAASEDIGLADPQALILATSTMQAVEKIGMPESDCILAQLAVYLARAPKSTESYHAMLKCKEQIKNHEGPIPAVPIHLRNAPTKFMKSLGYGIGYNTLHKDESGLNYLPEELEDINFFE